MAASRVVRLTLFSGPQCSLCEIAKAELAKVKKQWEFDLEVINIQEKGQEKWKKKYVYWIPALHLDGIEIAKGRWDASTVLEALTRRQQAGTRQSEQSAEIPGAALGEECGKSLLSQAAGHDLRLCFNCGSPDHAVASCPEPIDQQLVSLSRQLFNFFQPELGGQEFIRFHIAEGRKQQRLQWLRSYEPGVIRGPPLRDALGLREGDPGNTLEWLRNMTYWGYPPGWAGHRDPTELVRRRILEDEAKEQFITERDPFTIFESVDDEEEVDLTLFRRTSRSPSEHIDATSSLTMRVGDERTRWATYPDTYFSSAALTVYNGTPLDEVASSTGVSVTFTTERRALWERILGGTSDMTPTPPWRVPGVFGVSGCLALEGVNPPPPSTTPPPLPLTPSSPRIPNRESTLSLMFVPDDRSVVDMDVSDSE